MPLAKASLVPSRFITFLTVVLVVAVLRIAEEVMIPVALALMLAFLLSPVVVRLTRWRLPKALAVIVTASLAFAVITTVAWQLADQAFALLNELPRYEANLNRKVSALKHPEAGSVSRALATVDRLWRDLQSAGPEEAPREDGKWKNDRRHAPVPVEVKARGTTPFELARDVVSGLFRPLGTAGIVIVLVIAILFQREDLRSRFIRVVSGGRLNTATEAIDDAAQRVSRYLLAQLAVNTCFGLGIGAGLTVIGIPHAALWGVLATVLRFIPFLGPLIAVVFPLTLAAAVDPGWSMVGWTLGLFVGVEIVTNNLIEVLVYGTRTGISTLALLAAAIFWSWLWGLPGLFLSTPLTVCLLVCGQYVPGLKFLGVLLGSEPALDPASRFYQAMLSMDQEELFEQAERGVEQRSLAEFYDDVFVPALLMAETDRHDGVLAEVRQRFIFESSRELIEELEQRRAAARPAEPAHGTRPPFVTTAPPVVLGLPARDEADELVALMLAHLLREAEIPTRIAPVTTPLASHDAALRRENALVFVSALPPATLGAAARVCRHVRETNARAHVLAGVWRADGLNENLRRRLDPAGANGIVTRLTDAVARLQALQAAACSPAGRSNSNPPLEIGPVVRARTELAVARPDEAADTVVRELARAFDVPVSLVFVVESDRAFWTAPGSGTTAVPAAENSVYADVLAGDASQVIEDLAKDERLARHPLLLKRGVRFLASAPLRTRNCRLVGHLCVLDTKPRQLAAEDRERLEALAAQLMAAVAEAPLETASETG